MGLVSQGGKMIRIAKIIKGVMIGILVLCFMGMALAIGGQTIALRLMTLAEAEEEAKKTFHCHSLWPR